MSTHTSPKMPHPLSPFLSQRISNQLAWLQTSAQSQTYIAPGLLPEASMTVPNRVLMRPVSSAVPHCE